MFRTIVLLGAGASVEAGVPLAESMTRGVLEFVRTSGWPAEARLLDYICAAMTAHDARSGGLAGNLPDIERAVTAVELLAARGSLEIAPFVAAWDASIDRVDLLPSSGHDLRAAVLKALNEYDSGDALLRAVRGVTGMREPGSIESSYKQLLEVMIRGLQSRLALPAGSVTYLEPLVTAAHATGITIATLNYDMSIENTAAALGVPVDTGLESWSHGRIWDVAPATIRLIKLHGSTDWRTIGERAAPGQLARTRVERTSEALAHFPPALIFGGRNKLRADGPFLDLLRAFQEALRNCDRLVVIGYSFRDEHINQMIRQWLIEDGSRTIEVVDLNWPDAPSRLEPFPYELSVYLANAASMRDPPPPRLFVRREAASVAIADIFGV